MLKSINPASRSDLAVAFDNLDDAFERVLGLQWDSIHDSIRYHVTPQTGIYTKRGVLSVIARLYDPIGLLTPVTFWAKEFLQRLWQLGVHWDTKLPQYLAKE